MTQSNPLHPKASDKGESDPAGGSGSDEQVIRSATWAAALLSLAALALFVYAITSVNFHDFEDYILVGFPVVLAGASLASAYFVRRGRLALGSGVVFGLNLIVPILMTVILSRTFWSALLYGTVSSTLLIWRALPRRSWRWSIIATSIVLILVVVINIINPPGRLTPPPEFDIFFAVVIVGLIAAFLVQAARQAWTGNIRVKLITSLTVVAVASLGILGTVTYFNYRDQIRQDIRQRLLNIISLTALQQDGDLFATINTAEDMQTETYQKMQATNAAILATDRDLEYVWAVRLDEEGKIHFVLDNGLEEGYEPIEVGTVYEDPSELLADNISTLDHPIVEEDFYTDIYGTFLSAYAPIYTSDGTRAGIVGVDITADKVLAEERAVFLLILGTTVSAMVLAMLLGTFISTVFTRPILSLSHVAQKITEGDLSARAKIETSDEVGDLAKTFNAMTSQLQGTLQGLEQRVADRTRNLELAAEVGRSVSQVRALDVMLSDACELILKEFNLYYVQVYLADPSGPTLKLEAGTGTVGAQLVGRGHSLPLDSGSINGRAAIEKRSVVISDTAQSATFRKNPLLPETRGEMAVPLIVADQVVGVLDMQSSAPGILTEEVLPAFEALAGQLAVAVQNANLLTETEQARAQVEAQARRLVREGWNEHLDAIHKPKQLGFLFNHHKVIPLAEMAETQLPEDRKVILAPITVTGESLGSLEVEIDDESSREQTNELVDIVARQVAQQIENLRLLESAERYRAEAEDVSRRLTREGWKTYVEHAEESLSYFYDLKEVRPHNGNGHAESAVALPLKVRDEELGKLAIQDLDASDSQTIEFVNAVAERLSAHIESLRQFDETRRGQVELDRRAQQLAAVAEISTASSKELDIQKLLESVVNLTQRKFGLYHVHIFTYDEHADELQITACGWQEGDEHEGTHETVSIPLSREQSLVARAARTRQAVIVNDVKSEPDWLANPLLPDTASEMAVPLIIGDQVLGVLDVQADRINAFTQEDANIQATLASQIATALQNARSFEQAQLQAERESMLNTIGQKIQGATSVEAVLQIAARELGRALGAPLTIAQLGMAARETGNMGHNGNGNGH
jgi:GAF domain-containing protein/HAMP domain-containing protein